MSCRIENRCGLLLLFCESVYVRTYGQYTFSSQVKYRGRVKAKCGKFLDVTHLSIVILLARNLPSQTKATELRLIVKQIESLICGTNIRFNFMVGNLYFPCVNLRRAVQMFPFYTNEHLGTALPATDLYGKLNV